MKTLLLPMAVLLLCSTACQKDNDSKTLSLEAERYSGDAKMHLENDYAVWDSGDPIALNGERCTVSIGNDKATIAIPNAIQSAEQFYAIYPYAAVSPSGYEYIHLPEVQNYRTEGGRQILDAPMVAKTSKGTLMFRNLGALLALNVTNSTSNTLNVKHISVTNEETQFLSGLFSIQDLGADNVSISSETADNNSKTVVLDCGEGVAIAPESNKVFYISLPPIKNGKLSIGVFDDNYNYILSQTNSRATFERNHIYDVPFNASTQNKRPHILFTADGVFDNSDAVVGNTLSGQTITDISHFSDNYYITFDAPLTYIDEHLFFGTNITSLTIPSSVTKILSDAFVNCNEITSIFIPNSVQEIEYNAFRACSHLESVVVKAPLTEFPDYIFAECPKLHYYDLPETMVSFGNALGYESDIHRLLIDNHNFLENTSSYTIIIRNQHDFPFDFSTINPILYAIESFYQLKSRITLSIYVPDALFEDYIAYINEDGLYLFASRIKRLSELNQ